VAAEVVLGALLSYAVVHTATSRSRAVAVGVPLAATIALTAVGAELAAHAPAFNPAVAAAWAWRGGVAPAGLAAQAATFWAAPLAGAVLAGLIWRILDEDAGRKKGRSAGKARATRAAAAKKRA
jgi:hypothetical protein